MRLAIAHRSRGQPTLPGAGTPRRNAPGGRGVQAFAPEMLLPKRAVKAPHLGWVMPVAPLQPAVVPTYTRHRVGPTPKMSVGRHPVGLGQVAPIAGFQTPKYGSWTPLEQGPATRVDAMMHVTHDASVEAMRMGGTDYHGQQIRPSYEARGGPYARLPQAQRFVGHWRSSIPWAQASFSPKQRPLVPSQQPTLLHRVPRRRQIPAATINTALYSIGYPQSVAVAARLGGGPISTLGGMSQ